MTEQAQKKLLDFLVSLEFDTPCVDLPFVNDYCEKNCGDSVTAEYWRRWAELGDADREEVGAGDCISRQAVIDKLDRLIEVERKQGKELNYCRVRFAAVILSRKREILTAVVMYIG